MPNQLISSEKVISNFLQPVILFTFLGVLLFFVIMSAILNFHWTQYGIDTAQLSKIRRVYFGVSGILLMAITIFMLLAL